MTTSTTRAHPASTLLTPIEVAARLGLAEGTLRNWRAQGLGPRFIRTGGRVRYRESCLEAWLTANEMGAA